MLFVESKLDGNFFYLFQGAAVKTSLTKHLNIDSDEDEGGIDDKEGGVDKATNGKPGIRRTCEFLHVNFISECYILYLFKI